MRYFRHLSELLLGVSLAMLSAAGTVADDIDIFFSEETVDADPDFQPNVLFILDTSGSMNDEIQTFTPYDPDTNYGDSPSDRVFVYTLDYDFTGVSIDSGRNNCRAMQDKITADTQNPTYIGRAAQWNPFFISLLNSWGGLSNSSRMVECQDDGGMHGPDDPSNAVYAANGDSGPYNTNSNAEINWASRTSHLFVSANYHDYLVNGGVETRTLLDIMKEATSELINSFSGLNVGVMRFDTRFTGSGSTHKTNGGYAQHHFSDIVADRDTILAQIEGLTANSWTPLAETLWEAHRYYGGLSVDFGTNSHRDPAAVTNGVYNSPIANACQRNFVVYMTDGEPTRDWARDSQITDLSGDNCAHSEPASGPGDSCLDNMAGYMATNDYRADLDGVQNVVIHTIGFNIDLPLLEETARKGQGQYHTAFDIHELKGAFSRIIVDILSSSTTFIAPAVAVNAFNTLQHRNEVYYAIFAPQLNPRWLGNVKKYRINANGQVLGADGQPVIDTSTGYFLDTALSFWSSHRDGGRVDEGGAASRLSGSRTVYTVTSSDPNPENVKLSLPANTIGISNGAINRALLGLPDDADDVRRDTLIEWILGHDSNSGDVHHFFADPLHTRPAVVTYGGTADNPDDTLYVMTNDGTIRAVDASDGSESFAFIPRELLPNQLGYLVNDPDGDKIYGLDGPLTVWRHISNPPDTMIDKHKGDHVYLYFGMRRGGRNYYAMDVTDRDNPILKWVIYGGFDGFENLGQTWSTPIRSRVNWDCEEVDGVLECEQREVLFFGGGYDPVHDDATDVTTGDLGSAIYMVDADTGELLWSAGKGSDYDLDIDLENSIAGDLSVNDVNNNGFASSLFATDIAGNIWRVDINASSESADDFATGGRVAALGDIDDFRRFYLGPNVALARQPGTSPFFVISQGSGYMAQPRDESVGNDRLYGLFVGNIFQPELDKDGNPVYHSLTNDDLLDVTDPDSEPAYRGGNAPHGYFMDLTAPGEKVVRPSTTQFGTTIFTSYIPHQADDNADDLVCGVGHLGRGRLYARNFLSGKSRYNEEYIDLKHPGIPPSPSVLYVDDSADGRMRTTPILCVGTECFGKDDEENPFPDNVPLHKVYWRENIR